MEKFREITRNEISKLPKTSGVYCFYQNNEAIYIGKAINIKNRVKNHFQGKTWWEQTLLRQGFGGRIGFIKTDSEIEALILEAHLIKKYLPKFNVVWRDDKNYFYIAIARNKDNVPYIFITHQINKSKILNHKSKIDYIGPFVEGNALKKTLKLLRKVFPYYTLSKHPNQKCTWCHLDLCPGPNPNLANYKKNIKKLILILHGKSKTVLNSLKKEMKELSKQKNFEKAGVVRDKMYALEQIMKHANIMNHWKTQEFLESSKPQSDSVFSKAFENTLSAKNTENIKRTDFLTKVYWYKTEKIIRKLLSIKSPIKRIECYDVSNIQGKYATGSMVVFMNGKPDKNKYRKFKIKMKNEPNDIAMLKEVLTRRFLHQEWKYPEVILIDGGRAQLNVAIKCKMQISNLKMKIKSPKFIKVISIAKGRQELFVGGRKKPIPLKDLPQEIYNLIKHLDDEAHRFAITYHKKLRKKSLLT